MTDELGTLRAALKAAPPTADVNRKDADIAAALRAFDEEKSPAFQESAAHVRPENRGRIWTRLVQGGTSMLNSLTTRAGLATTTGLVTAGLAVILILPQTDLRIPSGTVVGTTKDTPVETRPAKIEPATEESTFNAPAQVRRPEPRARLAQELDAVQAPAPSDAIRDSVEAATSHMALEQIGTSSGAAARVDRKVGVLADSPAMMAVAPPSVEPIAILPTGNTERFANEVQNPLKVTTEEPVSTFSVDVDTASWAFVRSSLMGGYLPPAEAVRIEEMVNYFAYDYAAPDGEAPFATHVSVSETPWNTDTQIVHIGLQGEMPQITDRPPLNLVFLIDTSGSMQDANKLPLLKQSLRLMLGQLRPEDQVAIVTYAGSAGQVLEPTPASESGKILASLDQLEAGGSTAGQAGLQQAYAVAKGMSEEGDVTRVLLATDGDFNVGISDPEELKRFIEDKREDGAYLSVLGFGRGNLNDTLMQSLAQNGNGQAAYIDTIAEAQKVLVDQLTGTLFPIAQDVKVQVEFNPTVVAEYRLIGYETRALRREDFNNDKVDAGEIGAGHQVTALYEITPVGSDAVLTDPLRYQTAEAADGLRNELGLLRLRYKEPGAESSQLIEQPIPVETSEAGTETQFAAAIAGFGQLLRGSDYLGKWTHADAIQLANGARGDDPYGYRSEAVRLMRIAESLSQR